MTTKKRTISQGVRAYLRENILSGRYKAGMYLPSERALAEELGVSKTMIHLNLELLQGEGLLQMHHGRGALVCKVEVNRRVLNRFFTRPSDFGSYAYLKTASKLLEGVCRGAEVQGAEMLMSFSDSVQTNDEIIMYYNSGLIQGVIYFECKNKDILKPLQKAKIPYIIACDENFSKLPGLCIDARETARRAVRYLVNHGHKRIGFINGDPQVTFYNEFAIGFRGALAEEELEYRKDWIIDSVPPETKGQLQLKEFLSQKDLPSAFFSVRDYRTACFYGACEDLGFNIPNDFSIISFDNITWPDAAANGLTTFREPCHELGEGAVDMLSQWVRSGKKPEKRTINCKLIERSSVVAV